MNHTTLDPRAVKEELLKAYPTKLARKRDQQIVLNSVAADGTVPEVKAAKVR